MAVDTSTIARPYAKAVFEYALESKRLKEWSKGLRLIAEICVNDTIALLLDEPTITSRQLAELVIDVCGKHIGEHMKNFIHLLAENRRLALASDIFVQFEELRAEQERTIEVDVESFSDLSKKQQTSLKASLKEKLQRDVTLNVTLNPELLGGAIISAGDIFVIDGSVRGKLSKLATQLAV